jgi:hypothetical protein
MIAVNSSRRKNRSGKKLPAKSSRLPGRDNVLMLQNQFFLVSTFWAKQFGCLAKSYSNIKFNPADF